MTATERKAKAAKSGTAPQSAPAKRELVEVPHDTKHALDRAAEAQGVPPALFIAAAVQYVLDGMEDGTLDITLTMDDTDDDGARIIDRTEIFVERKTTMEDLGAIFIAGAPNGDFQSIDDSIMDTMRRGQAAEKLFLMLQSLDN